ncbi:MAG TPA: YHS domain-containing protein, partial [Nitrospira sp.]|nr:YHS domain-containing protein [Nitrospira sp.]
MSHGSSSVCCGKPHAGHDRMSEVSQDMKGHAAHVKPEIDPICGMTVDPARAAGQYDYKGKTYYFCAVSCLERFRADPERALNKKPLNPIT